MAIQEVQEIKVWHKIRDSQGEDLRHEARRTLGIETGPVQTRRVYWVQGTTAVEAETLGRELLADPIIQDFAVNDPNGCDGLNRVIVTYKPEQTDPENQFIQEAAGILGIIPEAVKTGWEYGFPPTVSEIDRERILHRLLVNPTVEQVVTEKPSTLMVDGDADPVRIIPLLDCPDNQIQEVLINNGYRFSPGEVKAIIAEAHRMGRNFTDLELSSIEQNWSEHSGHKTTKATLMVDGEPKKSIIGRIKDISFKYPEKIVSAFDDNAGGIPFCPGWVIVAKGETHNWPVRIGPYQGSLTREGGVKEGSSSFWISCP